MLAEWHRQLPSGQIVAGGGDAHWKDRAIAIFTLVRACELKGDRTLLRQLAPEVRQAVNLLFEMKKEARRGETTNGRYGLLAPGFADGGLDGVRNEFTNTLWTLAGLKALARADEEIHLSEFEKAANFYSELHANFVNAARQEMVRDPRGFVYMPILMRDDPELRTADPWLRPRPQAAEWALSHAIFPGDLFEKDDSIVLGHIALMQARTKEDIPAETGWLWHDAVWTCNAAFVAEVYLWAGMKECADRTFRGFLNHASPVYTWREEQPLQNALVGNEAGDMPHNWASAECVRYLRHRLVLEDQKTLRLLDGVVPGDLEKCQPFSIEGTPTRFGRVSISAEPRGKMDGRSIFPRGESRTNTSRTTISSRKDL